MILSYASSAGDRATLPAWCLVRDGGHVDGTAGAVAAVLSRTSPSDAGRLLPHRDGALVFRSATCEVTCVGRQAGLNISADLVVAFTGRLDTGPDGPLEPSVSAGAAAELVAAAWRVRGRGVLSVLFGDWSAVVHDRRVGTLVGLRDLMGRRVLATAVSGDEVLLASRWQDLLVGAGLSREPDPEWVAGFLAGRVLSATATPFRAVVAVAAGSIASARAGGTWSQAYAARPPASEDAPVTLVEAGGLIRTALDRAVSRRLTGTARPAATLSGGVDSTSVLASGVAVAPERPWQAVCMSFTDAGGDERETQKLVADQLGVPVTWADPSQHGPFGKDGPQKLFEASLAPSMVTNWFFAEVLAAGASTAGADLLFTGEDADSLLGGTSMTFLSDLLARGRLRRWMQEAGAVRQAHDIRWRTLLELSAYRAAPVRLRREWDRRDPVDRSSSVLARPLAAELDVWRRVEQGNAGWRPGSSFAWSQAAVSRPEFLAVVTADLDARLDARGVIASHPFMDSDLVALAGRLRPEHVFSGGLAKTGLRAAGVGRLPPEVLDRRRKTTLSSVYRSAVRDRQREHVVHGLAVAAARAEWFDASRVRSLREGLADPALEVEAGRVALLALWLETLPQR